MKAIVGKSRVTTAFPRPKTTSAKTQLLYRGCAPARTRDCLASGQQDGSRGPVALFRGPVALFRSPVANLCPGFPTLLTA
jgi:hypothetical protein